MPAASLCSGIYISHLIYGSNTIQRLSGTSGSCHLHLEFGFFDQSIDFKEFLNYLFGGTRGSYCLRILVSPGAAMKRREILVVVI